MTASARTVSSLRSARAVWESSFGLSGAREETLRSKSSGGSSPATRPSAGASSAKDGSRHSSTTRTSSRSSTRARRTALPGLAFRRGRDARRPARARRPSVLPQLVRIAAELGTGLDALHEAGLVHRDIKPSNVMLGADGAALDRFRARPRARRQRAHGSRPCRRDARLSRARGDSRSTGRPSCGHLRPRLPSLSASVARRRSARGPSRRRQSRTSPRSTRIPAVSATTCRSRSPDALRAAWPRIRRTVRRRRLLPTLMIRVSAKTS